MTTMRVAGGALAVTLAALLVSCNADPHQEQDASGPDHNSERYDSGYKQKEELEDFMRFLLQYNNVYGERNLAGVGGTGLLGRNVNGIGGSTMLGRERNLNGIGGTTLVGRNLDGLGGSSLLGRNVNGIGGSSLLGRNLNGIGGSSLLGRDIYGQRQTRYIDTLGGGNFVRNLDSLGGSNFVRHLDSLGGSNFVKRNLDQLGGPNFVKRHLDTLGGSNMQINRSLGGHKVRNQEGSLVRQVRETHHAGLLPYLQRRFDSNPYDKQMWMAAPSYGYYGEPPKRNFDEIDRSDLGFMRKRNFDEIDQTSMPFPYAKRFYHMFGSNYLDTPVSMFYDKKRNRPDYPMDEIDLSHFPIGSKRSMDSFPLSPSARR